MLEFSNGIEFVVGWPGSGKTFFSHKDLVSSANFDAIKVGNNTSPDYHVQFRSVKDLLEVLDRIYRSRIDPANQSCPVIIDIDEAILYLDSQKFKDLPEAFNSFLVQLRKMGVRIRCICPRASFINIKFRKICNVVTFYGEMRDPPTPGDFFVPYKVYVPADENALEDDPRNVVIKQGRKLHPGKRVLLDAAMRRLFPDSPSFQRLRYNTHEVIRTDFDVLDRAKLEALFPVTRDFPDADSYKRYVWESLDGYLRDIRELETPKVVSRYDRILSGLPIEPPEGKVPGDPAEAQPGAGSGTPPAASCQEILFFDTHLPEAQPSPN